MLLEFIDSLSSGTLFHHAFSHLSLVADSFIRVDHMYT